MRIAHVICTFPPYKGGMGNSAFYFSKILAQQGHDVTVFTPDYNNSKKDNEKFKVVRLKSIFKFGNAAFLPQLFWKLKNFDIAHFHYPFYGVHAVVVLGKLFFWRKTKLVIHYHMEPVAQGLKGAIFKLNKWFIFPFLARVADFITCASLDYIQYSDLSEYYNKHKNKFQEIFFGVDINRFKPREKLKDKKTILFVGGLDKAHYFKGIDILLKAISELKVENYKLKIIGEGALRSQYEKLAQRLGVADKVEFVGGVGDNELPSFYNNCDVLVLPSINQGEAFGIVLLEAMASEKPVIASNLPGVRSVFKDEVHGLLVKPGDSHDLSEKLSFILRNDELAEKMGKAGRKLVEEEYTWEKVGERLNIIYENLFNK